MRALRSLRRAAGSVRRWAFPAPELAAWRQACRQAERTPRFTPGRIRLMGYDLGYVDLLTLCPQWQDLFVRQMLRFEADQPAPRIIDGGANIGLASLYFKRLYPSARITAFEADPAIHAVLADNLHRNGAGDVEAVHAALWTSHGEIDFRCEGTDSGSVAEVPLAPTGPVRRVPAVRLRDVLDKEPVDFLKLDIEGAERAVLADCGDSLRQVRALCLELHEFDPSTRSTPEVLTLLENAGFTYALDELIELPSAGGTAERPVFPGRALAWAVLVRAFRSPGAGRP
jgi:FkbM family methyltransferase